jgi:hypothetical protein
MPLALPALVLAICSLAACSSNGADTDTVVDTPGCQLMAGDPVQQLLTDVPVIPLEGRSADEQASLQAHVAAGVTDLRAAAEQLDGPTADAARAAADAVETLLSAPADPAARSGVLDALGSLDSTASEECRL